LIASSRPRLASYRVLRLVRLFDALPVDASNKVVEEVDGCCWLIGRGLG